MDDHVYMYVLEYAELDLIPTVVVNAIVAIMPTLSSIFTFVGDTIAVSTAIGAVTDTISGAIDLISGFVDKIGGAISKAKDFVGSGVDKVKGALGFAYGKDRVPYDNYPAILHAGEKVLTRNQADQYERQMSTRGVQLKDVTPLDRDSSGDNSNTQVQTVQGGDAGNSKGGNWTINIEGITFPNARISSVEDAENLTDVVVDRDGNYPTYGRGDWCATHIRNMLKQDLYNGHYYL
ncbi:hypothetical protein [Coprococcus comes]|uniref:hypothetical protein n=1 Tax=Coprococcus comes TaxID=410072 RepID=UPI001FAB670E|nr:hypothetical protein [Coprococcus comes]